VGIIKENKMFDYSGCLAPNNPCAAAIEPARGDDDYEKTRELILNPVRNNCSLLKTGNSSGTFERSNCRVDDDGNAMDMSESNASSDLDLDSIPHGNFLPRLDEHVNGRDYFPDTERAKKHYSTDPDVCV
jgi:hypothetical protein